MGIALSSSHLCGAADRARTGMVSLPRDFKAECPQNKSFCKNQKTYKTGRFCAKTRQKMPEIKPFPSAPILPRFVIFPLLPKTFHMQNGRAIPVRTTLARRKNPPRRYTLISNTRKRKSFPSSRSLPQESFQKKSEKIGKRIKFPVPADVLIP